MPSPRHWYLVPVLALACLLASCADDNGTRPETLRFGQIGEIRVNLVVPRSFEGGEGELQQGLTWTSEGAWRLREAISYRGLTGDETVVRSAGDPGTYASAYASLITQLNEGKGIKLFVDELPQDLDPQCPPGATRIHFSIRDDVRERTASWIRCAQGSLGALQTAGAGPGEAASRIAQAVILMRDFTQGSDFVSTYLGSVPFGTLDRSEDSGAELPEPRAFFSVPPGTAGDPTGWLQFWLDHKEDPKAVPPEVDWTREMVIVAAVGERTEAGDSVEVRRILQTGEGTQVEIVERVPGDFCSPASRRHFPVHVVVAPRTLLDVLRFSDVATERVPCGF
jgi:hypothetical protein